MIKEEKLKRIVLYRLVERFSTIKEDEFNESMFHDYEHRDFSGTLNPSEKKDDEKWCIFLFKISKNKEYGEYGYWMFDALYEQLLVLVDRHIERYYKNRFVNYDHDEDILEELENNDTVYNRDEREDLNVLEFFMNETIEEFEKKVKLRSKQLEMTEDEYVDLVYLNVARMNKKNRLKKGTCVF